MSTPRKPPQDRKPAAAAAEPEEDFQFQEVEVEVSDGFDDDGKPITRTVPGRQATVRGITVRVPDEALDDFELLDDLRAAQDEDDGSRLPSLLRRLVGPQYREILDSLRDPVTKRVTVEDGARFVWDLFRALNPNS